MESRKSTYKHYYLLDTSVFCRFIEHVKISNSNAAHNIISKILDGYFYYMPQFCIAEVFNTFAKWHFAEQKISAENYKECRELFKSLIHDRELIYPYDLHRYHNLNCDKIYKIEHTTPRGEKKKGKLATFDILVIAMAIELQIIHGEDNISVLSCDDRLIRISSELGIKTELYS